MGLRTWWSGLGFGIALSTIVIAVDGYHMSDWSGALHRGLLRALLIVPITMLLVAWFDKQGENYSRRPEEWDHID